MQRAIVMKFREESNYPLVPQLHLDPSYSTANIWDAIVRIGPEYQAFALAMSHELHCIRKLDQVLSYGLRTKDDRHHVQHCFNYLRLYLLCEADLTLEPWDFQEYYTDFENGTNVNMTYGTRICRDWESLYSAIELNYIDWRIYAKAQVSFRSA
jgi:hypothetical protein